MESILLILASVIFFVGYIAIALEHPLKVSKSAIALITGSLLWILVTLHSSTAEMNIELERAGSEVFSIVVFLLAAMSLVEILVHYGLFDLIRGKMYAMNLGYKQQFILITLLSFFLSAVIDNLTTTIIMIQISRRFFKGRNLLVVIAGIVISANAGGAFSPIGDVTTIMLWFAKKFGTLEVIFKAIFPACILWLVAMMMLIRKLSPDGRDNPKEVVKKLTQSDNYVVLAVFASFSLPLVVSLFGLPPYFGLLLGLGCVWLMIDTLKRINPTPTHLSASIEQFIKKVDISSLKFFIGILLAVSALDALGILEKLALLVYGTSPDENTYIIGNVVMGAVSAILDNVPLTAIAIQMLDTNDTNLWILLALTVGTGGSLLVIGSAAGVIAMGMTKNLTFARYFRLAFYPALAGYIAAVAAWYIQNLIFH